MLKIENPHLVVSSETGKDPQKYLTWFATSWMRKVVEITYDGFEKTGRFGVLVLGEGPHNQLSEQLAAYDDKDVHVFITIE